GNGERWRSDHDVARTGTRCRGESATDRPAHQRSRFRKEGSRRKGSSARPTACRAMTAAAGTAVAPVAGVIPSPEIRTDGLVKVYGERRVVDGVNVRFAGGEVVGLLGPNGAGKTTTFYMIVGLITATEGRVSLDRADITHL